jgi:hypothetical protein
VDAYVDWSGVRERVAVAAKRGAVGLHSRFEPTLTAGEIAEVEAQYGITLPEEYRLFLAEVGAGGPGPALKLTTLSRIDGRWGWVWDTVGHDYPWLLDPSGAFVEDDEWIDVQRQALRAVGHEPTIRDDEYDYWHDYQAAFGEYRAGELWELHRGQGAVHISDNGCGATSYLIVVGPRRGELRFRDCGFNTAYEPEETIDGHRYDFYTWYMAWLEQHEARVGIRR